MFKKLLEKIKNKKGEPVAAPDREFHVSQPVLAFVSTYLENPSRFEIQDYWQGCIYCIVDKHTNERFSVRVVYDFFRSGKLLRVICYSHEWITDEEATWAFHTISRKAKKRHERMKELKTKRERRRLIKVYVKEGE